MGQPNDVLNYYLQRNDRIAAICNYCVGEALFTPENIKPMDGIYSVRNVKNKITHIQRDILRQAEVNGKRQVIGIIKHSQSLPELKEYIEKHREGFMHFSRSAADVIDVCVGIRALKEVMQYHKNEEKEEECNMCQAIDDLVRISTDEGITIGMEKGMEKGIEKGIAKGKSEAVVQLLEQHGAIPQETINRIVSEKNPEHLKRWLFLAASVKTVEEFCAVM